MSLYAKSCLALCTVIVRPDQTNPENESRVWREVMPILKLKRKRGERVSHFKIGIASRLIKQ